MTFTELSPRGRTVIRRAGLHYCGKYFSFLGDLLFTETGKTHEGVRRALRGRVLDYNAALQQMRDQARLRNAQQGSPCPQPKS